MLKLLVGLGFLSVSLTLSDSIRAQQVSSDGTLNTAVTGSSNNFVVTGGTTAGTNLFHSFRDFSIPTGGSVHFDHALEIQNIFSRVTGGTVSNIDGIIRTNGTANLFLLNPAGILFGANAQLNLGGSFIGTTAQTIRFADGTTFSATSAAPPLLTISTPIGLQMGSQANPIVNQSQASDRGLTVANGRTLALLGGDVRLQGGRLTASEGRVELGSVAPNSSVAIAPSNWALSYANGSQFQAIELFDDARIITTGTRGGDVILQGHTIEMRNVAMIESSTEGVGTGGQVTLRGTDRVSIAGNHTSDPYRTGIYTRLSESAIGKGGSIVLEAPTIRLSQATILGAEKYGIGQGGDITLQADRIDLSAGVEVGQSWTVISTRVSGEGAGQGGNITMTAGEILAQGGVYAVADTTGWGNAGNFTINTRQLQLQDSAQFGAGTFGEGDGGIFTINATELIDVRGFRTFPDEGIYFSGLFVSTEPGSTGNGSVLNLTTGKLTVSNGGKIAADSLGAGKAGSISIRAQEVEIADRLIDATGSTSGLLVSAVGQTAEATAGNLTIETDRLRVVRGGQITAETSGMGQAGRVTVQARSLEVTGGSADGRFSSQITAQADGSANARTIDLQSDQIRVSDRGEISVSNTGTGEAGELKLQADSIRLDTSGQLTAQVAAGTQGNISIDANSLILRRGSNITTKAGTTANGGNIAINAPMVIGLEDSNIIANAVRGQGGNISITTQVMLGLQYRDRLTPENDITASSEFGINGTVQISTIGVDLNSGLIELPSNLLDQAQRVTQACDLKSGSSFIITGRGGLPQNPLELLSSNLTWEDLRDLSTLKSAPTANAAQPTALVEATSWQRNSKTGEIELVVAQTPQFNPSATCPSLSVR